MVICSSCVPESKKIMTEVELNPQDKLFQNIMSYEYKKQTDSIFPYFADDNPTYRYLAAKSAASIQHVSFLDSLYVLLDDPVVKVREMAAFAIGQIASPESEAPLLDAFRQRDTMSVDNPANAAILEAIGKFGSSSLAGLLAEAEGYRYSDTLLMRGKMKSLYYFALRDVQDVKISNYLIESLQSNRLDSIARLYAAHCLARTKNLDIETIKFQIAELFSEASDKKVKMALALALKNTSDPEIQQILLSELRTETDYRVKVNIIRALSAYSYIESAELITSLITGDNIHVALAACDFLYHNGIKEDVNYYRNISRDSLPWQVRAHLLKSINKLLPYYYSKSLNASRWQIQQMIKAESDTLVISHYINALAHDPAAYPWIIEFAEASAHPVLLTSCIQTLGELLADENFDGTFKSYAPYHRNQILDFIKKQLTDSEDEGVLGMCGELIANSKTQISTLIDSTGLLFEAKDRLSNPGHIESIHALERAIAEVRGIRKAALTEVAPPKEPEWSLLNETGLSPKAIVKTNKGTFTIDLFLNMCPGTVLNFVKLSRSDYYDNKIFHRVVPNFVAQTGSPRGDNYGGKDYVISSEFNTTCYDGDAYVGMASAGPHTESTQWFVTHSPAPHLDGKYTIFGKVTEGKSLIHKLVVGDTIEDIIISNL